MKTLAIITRVHPNRPNMLQKCVDSVKNQTSDDCIHILHRHDKTQQGYGKWNANKSLAEVKDIPARYAMVLDDDDMLVDPKFVEDFKKIVDGKNPEIVFFRGIIHRFGPLPTDKCWKRPPAFGRIGSFCLAVRADVWKKYIHRFGAKLSGGDFCFISACYRNTKKHIWWNRIVAKTQWETRAGSGRAEEKSA